MKMLRYANTSISFLDDKKSKAKVKEVIVANLVRRS